MDELVYLFELDSVRNSPREILRAQQALFREIALKGNQVVLSFNQLTDSESFLCAVRDPKCCQQILSLFSLGALKYSRFAPGSYNQSVDREELSRQLAECRDRYGLLFQKEVLKERDILPRRAPQRIVRTGSHYVQNAVERCLNTSKEQFLFSALPFRSDNRAMLSAIHYALEYSDPSILEEFQGAAADPSREGVGETGQALRKERMDFVKAYVELILRLSREPLACNPAKLEPHLSLEGFLKRTLEGCQPCRDPGNYPLWPLLCQGAQVLRSLWPQIEEKDGINDRTSWHNALREAAAQGAERPPLRMAEAMVDLCYNYTIAESIQGLTRRYQDEALFWADFLRRLPPYWKDGEDGVHQFLKPDRTAPAVPPPAKELPRWDTAVRLVRYAPGWAQTQQAGRGRKKGWGRYIILSLLRQIFSALCYALLFLLVTWLLELPEDQFRDLGAQGPMNPHLLTILSIVIFGVLGSFISWKFNLLDILEIFRQFGLSLRDGAVLLRAWWGSRGR